MNFSNDDIIKMYRMNNFSLIKTAEALGISDLREKIQNNKELAEMLLETEYEKIDIAESKLFELIKKRNLPAIKFYLETKGQIKGYGNKITVSHDSENEATLKAISRKYADDI